MFLHYPTAKYWKSCNKENVYLSPPPPPTGTVKWKVGIHHWPTRFTKTLVEHQAYSSTASTPECPTLSFLPPEEKSSASRLFKKLHTFLLFYSHLFHHFRSSLLVSSTFCALETLQQMLQGCCHRSSRQWTWEEKEWDQASFQYDI